MGNHLLNEGKLDEHLVICTFIFLIGRIGFKKLILPSSLNFCCSSFKGTKIQSLSVTWNAETENLMAKKGVSYPACLASHPILVLEPRNLKPFFFHPHFFSNIKLSKQPRQKNKNYQFCPPWPGCDRVPCAPCAASSCTRTERQYLGRLGHHASTNQGWRVDRSGRSGFSNLIFISVNIQHTVDGSEIPKNHRLDV